VQTYCSRTVDRQVKCGMTCRGETGHSQNPNDLLTEKLVSFYFQKYLTLLQRWQIKGTVSRDRGQDEPMDQ
jgi:hypothetical protein